MRAIAFVVVSSMVLLSTVVLADVPGLINYQGTLTDTNGVAIDTTVSMIFSIYTDSTGGTQVWTESQASVVVSHGLFNVLLGRVNSISDTVFKDPDRWLGVQVGTDAELQPRERIASVGYAFKAADAQSGGGWTDDGTVVRLTTVTDSVGIGTAIPAEKLHVVGSAKVDSTLFASRVSSNSPLQLQTVGMTRIYIDDTSGNVGIGTLSPAEKLEVAGTAQMTGFKMPMGATASYVLTSDATGVGTWQPPGGVGDGDWSGASTGFMYASNVGDDIGIGLTAPVSGSKVEVTKGNINVDIISSSDNGIGVANVGPLGHGIFVSLYNPANALNGVDSWTAGTGFGVYGESDKSDGVHGKTQKAQTFNILTDIKGGVHGRPKTAYYGDADNFSVVGTPDENSATGVLGIGGMKGHGVVGIPGGDPGFTTAGVRGITYEGGWPPAHFPLTPAIIKEQVGVLGQAAEYVGVWGESIYRLGVVGTVGRQLQYSDLLDSAGVYGYSDISYGVIGEADLDDSSKAGVQAIGDGVNAPGDPRAAALEIRNGAVCVSGAERPAGTITFLPAWAPYVTEVVPANCDCTCYGHAHIYAYYATVGLFNNLIVQDSIILLTVEDSEPMFAQVTGKGTGFAGIQVTCVTPPPAPAGNIQVHYLIINPFPPGQ